MRTKDISRTSSGRAGRMRAMFAEAAQFALGFIFSGVVIGGLAPLGVAFSANCSFAGLIGALLGYMVGGFDVWRYLIACTAAYFGGQVLFDVINAEAAAKRALFTLWSTLLAGVCGNILGEYTFAENMMFFVSGIFGALFAYVFSVAYDSVRCGRRPSDKIVCVSFISIAALVFLGLLSMRGIAANAGCILVFFIFFCLAGRAGLLYMSTVALIFSFSVCVLMPEFYYLAGIIVLGAVLSSLLAGLGRIMGPVSFILSTLLFSLYYPGEFSFWVMFYDILIAGAIFMVLPSKVCDRMFSPFIPLSVSAASSVRKRYRSASRKVPEGPCSDCAKREDCWQVNYRYTSEVFAKASADIASPEFSLPRRFRSVCPHTAEVVAWLRSRADAAGNGCKVDFARASLSKSGEIRCGDTSGMFLTSDNRCVLCISDGMGSGAAAARQSESADRMLKTLISRGVEKRDALQAVNDALLKSGKETILGMDMTVIDLLNRRCEMLKSDAAPTFVIRKGAVYLIGSASLPMGMTETPDIKSSACTLLHGDYLVMVSDGLINNGTKYLSEFLTALFAEKSPEPLQVAEQIMKLAVHRRIVVDDDVTVVVARISADG